MLADAAKRVAGRPGLILFLAVLNLGVALLCTEPLSATLQGPLDLRPAATSLISGGDDGLVAELVTDHPELVRVAALSGRATLLVYGVLSWLLAGGLLGVLGGAGPRGPRAFLVAVGEHAVGMLKIGGLGLGLRLVAIAVGVGGWFALKPLWYGHGLVALVLVHALDLALFGLSWSLGSVALDYARGLQVGEPALSSGRALWHGLRLVWQEPAATVRLVAGSAAGFVLLSGVSHGLGLLLPTAPGWSALLLVVVRLGVAFGRAYVTTAVLFGAALTAQAAALTVRPQTAAAPPG
jgi:hypothetical protein